MIGANVGYFIYLALLLLFIGSAVLYSARNRVGQTVQYAAIWALIFLGVVVIYGFRDVLGFEVFGRQSIGENRILLPRGPGGHFRATLEVNEVAVNFIVDTGASQLVLSRADAQRIGLELDRLSFHGRSATANGIVKTAPVVLDQVVFGEFRDVDQIAVVNQGDLDVSLLGMQYLRKFSDISIRGDVMILER